MFCVHRIAGGSPDQSVFGLRPWIVPRLISVRTEIADPRQVRFGAPAGIRKVIGAMRNLKPVKRVRHVEPRTCAFCKHLLFEDGTAVCERPFGPEWDISDGEYRMTVCDRFRRLRGIPAEFLVSAHNGNYER